MGGKTQFLDLGVSFGSWGQLFWLLGAVLALGGSFGSWGQLWLLGAGLALGVSLERWRKEAKGLQRVNLAGFINTQYRPGPKNPDLPRWDQSKHTLIVDTHLTNTCQDQVLAEEKPPYI